MKILITGIAGFLGSNLAARLLDEGHKVLGNDNLMGGKLENVPKDATVLTSDCCDFEAMKALCKGVDVVIHCAATAHEGLSVFSPAFITKNNYQASVTTMTAAIAANVKRFVFCSSMARYGSNEAPFTEDMECKPQDPYAIAKVASEQTLKLLAETHGIEWNIAIPHNIVGPRQNYTDPFRNVMSIMLNRNLRGLPAYIYGDGSQVRCFSYVDDCVDGLVKLALDKNIKYETVNLGPDTGEVTIKEFAFNYEKTYVIANSFSNPDEVFELNNGQLTKISKANEFFTKKVKTWDCQYKRIDTGKSEIDTWGIFVGKDKPTILNIHGGPASQYAFTFFDEFQTYASAGFNVIACNPRGSSGRGHDFLRDVCGNKWGVTDMHDVLTSFKKMKKIMGITNKNDGIMGGSYGGFMTSWIISHHPSMFKSAIVERALLNWETMVGTSDIGIGFPEMYLLDDMDKNINLYRKKSPITYASNIKTPTLILHSQEDYRCPIEQAEQLFSNLKRRGVKTAMLRFPGESHELSRSGTPNHRKQRFDHVIKWHKDNLT